MLNRLLVSPPAPSSLGREGSEHTVVSVDEGFLRVIGLGNIGERVRKSKRKLNKGEKGEGQEECSGVLSWRKMRWRFYRSM